MQNFFSRSNLFIIFIPIASVYIFGMLVDIMDIDAAQYASIALEMLKKGSYLEVFHRNQNYLDKPPLLFWLSSLSFSVFGLANWTYKLPSVLFSVLSIYSTYRFAKLFYTANTAIFAAIILATSQAYFLINNDCRTDTILIGSISFTSWQLAEYLLKRNPLNFILAFVGIALGMLSKGPLGLMVPALGFGTHLLVKKDFKNIFQWQWLLGIAIVVVVLLPMCYGLYTQFGTKGLYFYFWEQSFGRITGSNSWNNSPDPFFLFHSFLWSFLPWTILFLFALVHKIAQLVKTRFQTSDEIINISAIVLSYIILSRSKYQLPHYIYGILPFASIITAQYLLEIVPTANKKIWGFLSISQWVVCFSLWIVAGLLAFVCFESGNFVNFIFGVGPGVVIGLMFNKKLDQYAKYIVVSLVTAVGVNAIMSLQIYPSLLDYQPSKKVAATLKNAAADEAHTFSFRIYPSYSLDFYAQMVVKEVKEEADFDVYAQKGEKYFCYTNSTGFDFIKSKTNEYETLGIYESYPVTKLTLPFLNPNTRSQHTETRYLVRFKL